MDNATDRQLQILNFLKSYRAKTGRTPSYSAIARELGVASKATAYKHVSALRTKGLLQGEAKAKRRA